jgi:hypothetical protein
MAAPPLTPDYPFYSSTPTTTSGTTTTTTADTTSTNSSNNKKKNTVFLLDHLPLPSPPRPPQKCPLYCCFYAVFDNKVGPKMACQSPKNFMHHDINISTEQIHDLLAKTFSKYNKTNKKSNKSKHNPPPTTTTTTASGTRTTPSTSATSPTQTTTGAAVTAAEATAIATRSPDNKGTTKDQGMEDPVTPTATSPPQPLPPHDTPSSPLQPVVLEKNIATETAVLQEEEEEKEEEEKEEETCVHIPEGSLSIFDSTSEYIITGHELSDKVINLSTHGMHIITRPTVIHDDRYARNALLFSVGFVLRRAADPRPFRPLLSKWALTLRSMEVESHILSKPNTTNGDGTPNHDYLQTVLERLLISLNSYSWECNLLLNPSNALNLKLFQPPKPVATPVHDYQVPILLRRDLQLQMVRNLLLHAGWFARPCLKCFFVKCRGSFHLECAMITSLNKCFVLCPPRMLLLTG